MEIFESSEKIYNRIMEDRTGGLEVGFVPTMGALHEGHCALFRKARQDNDKLVISCYVNAPQFDSCEAAVAYPREFEKDRQLALDSGVDYLFHPDDKEIYPSGDSTTIINNSPLVRSYEGVIRTNFFNGVTTVVGKLMNIVPAQRVYFGQKDLQQYLVLKQLCRDLHWRRQLIPVPVVRDENGVALSSRNRRLDSRGWQIAAGVHKIMKEIKRRADELSRQEIFSRYVPAIKQLGFELQYLDVVRFPDYDPAWPADKTAVLIIAGYAGEVRLKDNLPLHLDDLAELE